MGAIGVEPCVRVGEGRGARAGGAEGVSEAFGPPRTPAPHPRSPPVPPPAARGAPGCPPSWWGKLAALHGSLQTLHGSLQTHAKPPVPSANQLIAFQVEDPKVIWDQDEPRKPDKAGH